MAQRKSDQQNRSILFCLYDVLVHDNHQFQGLSEARNLRELNLASNQIRFIGKRKFKTKS